MIAADTGLFCFGLSPSESSHFAPVAASGHTAPPAMMRLGAVVEPKNATVAFAFANQTEVAVDE
jgi:hypothetical protein